MKRFVITTVLFITSPIWFVLALALGFLAFIWHSISDWVDDYFERQV